jgi:hypothetical protein
VTTTPPESSYQAVLDWLQRTSLVDSIGLGVSVPNWIVALLAGGVLLKVSRSNGAVGGGRR